MIPGPGGSSLSVSMARWYVCIKCILTGFIDSVRTGSATRCHQQMRGSGAASFVSLAVGSKRPTQHREEYQADFGLSGGCVRVEVMFVVGFFSSSSS